MFAAGGQLLELVLLGEVFGLNVLWGLFSVRFEFVEFLLLALNLEVLFLELVEVVCFHARSGVECCHSPFLLHLSLGQARPESF